MIVAGCVEPSAKVVPVEFAVEMKRLIELQVEGPVGSSNQGETEGSERCYSVFKNCVNKRASHC